MDVYISELTVDLLYGTWRYSVLTMYKVTFRSFCFVFVWDMQTNMHYNILVWFM